MRLKRLGRPVLLNIVAHASSRFYIHGIRGVVFYLGPQASDVHVDGPGLNECFVFPYGIKQLVAAEHPAPSFHQMHQELEFRGAEVNRDFTLLHAVSFHVDAEVSEADHFFRCRLFAGPSENGVNTGYKLLGAEGLCYIIVRTGFQPADFIRFISFCRKHDDGEVLSFLVLSEDAAEFQTLDAGKHKVEYDEMKVVFFDLQQSVFAVCSRRDRKTRFFEIVRNQFNKIRLVIDDENVFIVHGGIVPISATAPQSVYRLLAFKSKKSLAKGIRYGCFFPCMVIVHDNHPVSFSGDPLVAVAHDHMLHGDPVFLDAGNLCTHGDCIRIRERQFECTVHRTEYGADARLRSIFMQTYFLGI